MSTKPHLLRLILSCRRITAQVTAPPPTNKIIAMVSTTEEEFLPEYRAKLARHPRIRYLWDKRVAARVGEKLGHRLKKAGVTDVSVDVTEEVARPVRYREMVLPLFVSVKQAGVNVNGFDKLKILKTTTSS